MDLTGSILTNPNPPLNKQQTSHSLRKTYPSLLNLSPNHNRELIPIHILLPPLPVLLLHQLPFRKCHSNKNPGPMFIKEVGVLMILEQCRTNFLSV